MRIKKKKAELPTPDQILEQRVDAMMDPKRPEFQTLPSEPDKGKAEDKVLPPLNIFDGATSAPPVPSDMAGEIPIEQSELSNADYNNKDSSASETQDVLTEPQLDDAVSDAAVDDIVAHESDTVLAAEDAALKSQNVHEPKPRKIHRHPVFWTLVAFVAIVAVTLALLLVSGGNWHLPGVLQSAKNALLK